MSNHPRPRGGGDFKFSRTTGQLAYSGNMNNHNQALSRISQGRQSWLTNSSLRTSSSSKTDFIRLNAERAIASRARQPKLKRVDSPHGTRVAVEPSGQVPNFRNKSDYGKIPKYMRRRKTEEVRESKTVEEKVEEIINIDEKMRYNDDEREQVVEFLQQYHNELNTKYQTLPLFIDTIGMRQRKYELETLMDEVQQAIAVMQSSEPMYKSDFPPKNSKFPEQWEEKMEEYEYKTGEEEAKFEPGVHYSVVW